MSLKTAFGRMNARKTVPAATALACVLLFLALAPCLGLAGTDEGCLRLDFRSLQGWKDWAFDNAERPSSYSIVRREGGFRLRMSSDASASALLYQDSVDVHRCPVLRWRWKVENVYEKGDATRKSGDDFPVRIFVCFFPEEGGAISRGLSRMLFGREAPEHILSYVWSSRDLPPEPLTNPYISRVKVVPVRSGKDRLGRWMCEQRNVIRDYRRAFGEDPPARARIAVMNDSDDTGESSVAYIDFITCLPE